MAAWSPQAVAAVQAGSGIIGNLITGRQTRKNYERQNAFNLEMWHAQNAYDHPGAQVDRLLEAGLNPNLVYGNGSVANTAAPAPRAADASQITPMFDPSQVIGNSLATYQSLKLQQAQIANIEAQTNNINARTVTESFRKVLTEATGKKVTEETRQLEGLWNFNAEIKQAESEKAKLGIDVMFQQLANMKADEVNKNLDAMYKQRGFTTQQIEQDQRQADLLYSQMRNEWMKMGVTTTDNPILRIVVRMANEAGVKDFGDLIDFAKRLISF